MIVRMNMANSDTKSRRPDGRLLRSERTRQSIIEAYLELVRENPQVPTAAQIAKRTGCSIRSVFERFADLLELRVAAVDYVFAQGLAQAVPRNTDADRQTRLRTQVEMRAQVCERWLPLWRALIHNQGESEPLRERIGRVYDLIAGRLQLMYRPELSTLSASEQKQLLVALEALTDFESWGRMRERHALSVEAACDLWINAIDRLLPPTPPAPEPSDVRSNTVG
jgi:AcrR family transcriptional regulator